VTDPTGDSGRPPPSTLNELAAVLTDYDRSRPRSLQHQLGPSELGTRCAAQIARKLAGCPTRPAGVPWAPLQGEAVHSLMEKVVAHWNTRCGYTRWLSEQHLHLDAELTGRCDAYDCDHEMVVDWKHAGKSTITKVTTAQKTGKPTRVQIRQDYRVQAHLYGLAYERAGRPVRWVRLVFLAREASYRGSAEWTERYIPEVGLAALDRYYQVVEAVGRLPLADDRDRIADIPATPGDGCYFCPFRRDGQSADWGGCPGTSSHWP